MKIKYLGYLVETKVITAVSARSDTYSTNITKYSVNISFTTAGQQFEFKTQEDADMFVKMIHEAIDKEESEEKQPTYLEGFKDGTEYALKLMKETK